MPPDPRVIRETLALAGRLEREWQRKIAETDRSRTPWMPFPVPAFVSLLIEALPYASGDRFLGIGGGIGTKEMLAREICGLDATEVEINEDYAAQAAALGVGVTVGDAADYAGYGEADIIWFNRVFRDPDLQSQLEKLVWDAMSPGAVIMCANLESPPPGIVILDDWEIRRGIWLKPLEGP